MIKPGYTPLILSAVLLLCASGAAPAHEGHDQAEPEPAAEISAARSAAPPQIELVARREGADIVLYLDDYASNAPLDGLLVSVRSGTLTQQAAASGEGAYRIAGDVIDAGGAQPLQVSVHGPGIDVQLQAELPPQPATPAQAAIAASNSLWLVAIALAALAASAAAWLFWRRRRERGLRGVGNA